MRQFITKHHVAQITLIGEKGELKLLWELGTIFMQRVQITDFACLTEMSDALSKIEEVVKRNRPGKGKRVMHVFEEMEIVEKTLINLGFEEKMTV